MGGRGERWPETFLCGLTAATSEHLRPRQRTRVPTPAGQWGWRGLVILRTHGSPARAQGLAPGAGWVCLHVAPPEADSGSCSWQVVQGSLVWAGSWHQPSSSSGCRQCGMTFRKARQNAPVPSPPVLWSGSSLTFCLGQFGLGIYCIYLEVSGMWGLRPQEAPCL